MRAVRLITSVPLRAQRVLRDSWPIARARVEETAVRHPELPSWFRCRLRAAGRLCCVRMRAAGDVGVTWLLSCRLVGDCKRLNQRASALHPLGVAALTLGRVAPLPSRLLQPGF